MYDLRSGAHKCFGNYEKIEDKDNVINLATYPKTVRGGVLMDRIPFWDKMLLYVNAVERKLRRGSIYCHKYSNGGSRPEKGTCWIDCSDAVVNWDAVNPILFWPEKNWCAIELEYDHMGFTDHLEGMRITRHGICPEEVIRQYHGHAILRYSFVPQIIVNAHDFIDFEKFEQIVNEYFSHFKIIYEN